MKTKAPKSAPASQPSHPLARQFAYVEVTSAELTRDINRDMVLELIRANQPISRMDVARISGLQPSTVSSIVEQLLAERWISEGATVKTARGRRPTMLRLNDDLVLLVADVRPAQAVVAVVDLNGRFLSRTVVPLVSEVENGTKAIARAMQQLRRQHPDKTFEGAGVSMPGRVDPATSRLLLAPNLGWKDYDIRGQLSKMLELPVEMDNAANACLLAELWFGRLDRVHDAILVTISEGVGTAVLAEGRLIRGSKGLAGEFGHVVVDPAGPQCSCGQKGCWEVFASCRAALRYYSELKPSAPAISIWQLVELSMEGDKAASEAIHRQAVAIGRGIRMLNAALSPEVILFAGDITAFWDVSADTIRKESMAGVLPGRETKMISLGDGEMARLRGAATLVLQRHSGYYRSSHAQNERAKPPRKASNNA